MKAVNGIVDKCSITVTVSAGVGVEAGLSGKGNLLRVSTLPYCFPDLCLIV